MLGCTWEKHREKVFVMFLFGFATHNNVIQINKRTLASATFNYIAHDSLELRNRICQAEREPFALLRFSIGLKSCIWTVLNSIFNL